MKHSDLPQHLQDSIAAQPKSVRTLLSAISQLFDMVGVPCISDTATALRLMAQIADHASANDEAGILAQLNPNATKH